MGRKQLVFKAGPSVQRPWAPLRPRNSASGRGSETVRLTTWRSSHVVHVLRERTTQSRQWPSLCMIRDSVELERRVLVVMVLTTAPPRIWPRSFRLSDWCAIPTRQSVRTAVWSLLSMLHTIWTLQRLPEGQRNGIAWDQADYYRNTYLRPVWETQTTRCSHISVACEQSLCSLATRAQCSTHWPRPEECSNLGPLPITRLLPDGRCSNTVASG